MLTAINDRREKESTAQVLNVIYKVKHRAYVNPKSLLLWHSHFAKADIILRQNVHLLSIEKDVAKFMEFDSDIDLFNTRRFPFISVAHADHVKKIIVIPRWELKRIVAGINIDNREVVWLFHHLRCGSTLWGQIFNALPNWTVISENQTHLYNAVYASEESDIQCWSKTDDYEERVVAMMKLFCRLAPTGNKIFWKAEVTDHHFIPIIQKRFPKHKILFAYRDAIGAGKSFVKTFGHRNVMVWYVHYLLNRNHGPSLPANRQARAAWLWFTNGYNPDICLEALSKAGANPQLMEWMVLLWACVVTMMKEFQKEGVRFKCLKFEHLTQNPATVITDLFSHLNVPLDLVETALDAMKHDSQKGLFCSNENRQHNKPWMRTHDSVSKCNAILKFFNLPNLDDTFEM